MDCINDIDTLHWLCIEIQSISCIDDELQSILEGYNVINMGDIVTNIKLSEIRGHIVERIEYLINVLESCFSPV